MWANRRDPPEVGVMKPKPHSSFHSPGPRAGARPTSPPSCRDVAQPASARERLNHGYAGNSRPRHTRPVVVRVAEGTQYR